MLLSERLPGATGERCYSFFTGPARTNLKISFRSNRLVILQEEGYAANEWETPRGDMSLMFPEARVAAATRLRQEKKPYGQ